YVASGGPTDPGSWNRYTYTRGDPVNRIDPAGREDCGFCITFGPLGPLSDPSGGITGGAGGGGGSGPQWVCNPEIPGNCPVFNPDTGGGGGDQRVFGPPPQKPYLQ